MSWKETAVPTFFEEWPHPLRRLSFATIGKPLSPVETKAILCAMMDFGHEIGERNEEEEGLLKSWLESAIGNFPFGTFIKLGSRSPKDSWFGHREGFKCENAEKAWKILTDASERMYEDLMTSLKNDYRSWLLVREWKDIPAWQEFRCFVKDGKLVGVSQYDYLHCYVDEIKANIGSIEWGLKRFFEDRIIPALHLSTVVVDVWLNIKTFKRRDKGTENVIQGTLVEINPWWAWTDPCLFNWNDDKFGEFEFRYRTDPEPKKSSDPFGRWLKENSKEMEDSNG